MQTRRIYQWIGIYTLVIALLWVIEPFESGLQILDVRCAYFFNSLFTENSLIQSYWLFTNSRSMDWIFDLVTLGFFIYYILRGKDKDLKYRIWAAVFLLGYAVMIHCTRSSVFHFLKIRRDSPSLLLSDLLSCSEEVVSFLGRVESGVSYPAGHAFTIIGMILSVIVLMGRRAGLLYFLIAIVFLLPRLVLGAHWISDMYAGSAPLVFLSYGWLLNRHSFESIIQFMIDKRRLRGIQMGKNH